MPLTVIKPGVKDLWNRLKASTTASAPLSWALYTLSESRMQLRTSCPIFIAY